MKTLKLLLIFIVFSFKAFTQAVTLTPQGNTSSSFSLVTTSNVSQTGTPTVAQLIYNTNASITGTDANGIGYYFWNGSNWKSLDANIPQSTIIFSETHPNQTLINSGFSMIGTTQISTPALDVWRKISTIDAPFRGGLSDHADYSIIKPFQNKFYFFGSKKSNRGIYDVDTDTWIKMDTINVPDNLEDIVILKDRVFANYLNQGSASSWVYNLVTNNWDTLTTPSRIYNLLNFSNSNSNYGLAFLEDETFKLFDLSSNTWSNISMVNAPDLLSTSVSISLSTKFIVISNSLLYIYDIPTNQWSQASSLNAPDIINDFGENWMKITELSDDSTVYFAKTTFNTPNTSSTTVFKKYNFQQNVWSNTFNTLLTNTNPNRYRGQLRYIGKRLNKSYFYFKKDIIEFNHFNSQWRIIKNPDEISNGREEFGKMYLFENKIIKLGGSRSGHAGLVIFYDDAFILDLDTETWSYIPSVLSQEVKLNNTEVNYGIRSAFGINDKYLFSFFNQEINIDPITFQRSYVNQSAIMQISGSTNQTTQKLMYLYKKQ